MKLSEMGILNPKGNLYSKVPLNYGCKPAHGRNPMSPLPEPPVTSATVTTAATTTTATTATTDTETVAAVEGSHQSVSQQPRARTSVVDVSDQNNQSFTTSIYLNQSQRQSEEPAPSPAPAQQHVIPAKSYEPVTVVPPVTSSTVPTPAAQPSSGIKGIKWSVYLSKNKPTRHVTVIPINNSGANVDVDVEVKTPTEETRIELTSSNEELQKKDSDDASEEEHFYDAIFETDEQSAKKPSTSTAMSSASTSGTVTRTKRSERWRQQSPTAKAPPLPLPLPSAYENIVLQQSGQSSSDDHGVRRSAKSSQSRGDGNLSPPLVAPFKEPVTRRCSDRREGRHSSGQQQHVSRQHQQPMRIRKKSQRSSSLGPLLDDNQLLLSSSLAQRSANTNSLESIDSNPRRAAAAKNDPHVGHHHQRETGAVPRRPLQAVASLGQPTDLMGSGHHMGSPPRLIPPEFSRPLPPYLPLVIPGSGPPPPPTAHPPHPPHIPLPGLTCQLSVLPQPNDHQPSQTLRPSLREQQVLRLRQEIAHPAGVRLMLRKRDCQGSLALVEFFGCLWVAGWRQRDYPVLYNAFHIGDQILSVAGVPVRTANEFNKLVKTKNIANISASAANISTSSAAAGAEVLHVEIVIRRLPFAQVFHLKRDVEGQPLGIVTHGNTAEVREIVPTSPAATHGMTPKIRSFDGQTLVPWVLTEINGRPLNLFSKDGEAGDRLQALGRDVSVLLQPADIISKLKKQLKSHKNYKEYLLG